MLKKIFYHLTFALILLFLIFSVLERIEKFNPLIKAIKELSISDIYFAFVQEYHPSSEIYIVDIGLKETKQSRKEITNFLKEINSKYKPRVIGVDVFFDQNINPDIDNELISSMSDSNVIRMFKIIDNFNILYPDFGSFLNLDTNTIYKDGYTFGLGDATSHPCIRYFKPKLENNGITYNHFSKLIAEKYLESKNKSIDKTIDLDHKMIIRYNKDFANNRINIIDSSRFHELKDKIVLIGLNTYKEDGTPLYNEDVHYTPKNKYYIGRSAKDTYGVEILANITSNLINNDGFYYNESLVKYLNIFISLFIYISFLFIFIYFNKYFIIIKILTQTIGVFLLVMFSLFLIHYNNFYLDFTFSIAVMLVAAEIVKTIEGLLNKILKNR